MREDYAPALLRLRATFSLPFLYPEKSFGALGLLRVFFVVVLPPVGGAMFRGSKLIENMAPWSKVMEGRLTCRRSSIPLAFSSASSSSSCTSAAI